MIKPFALERYFAKHEFSTPFLLSSSDCDGLLQSEVLKLADPQTRELWDKLTLGYTQSLGLPLLRREVAGLYAGVDPDQVLVVVPQEGILLAMKSLLEAGDHVVCTFPGYQSLYELAADIGCAVDRWEPRADSGWTFDVDELAGLLKPSTKLIVVNFPHNPTGALPSPADYRRIVALARERDIHLFSDEMYRFLELDPADRLPSACELYGKAVSLFGMSKTFGMAGVRLGWLVTKDEALYGRMAALKDYTTICPAAPSEILALIGLRARDAIIAKHRARLQRNLALLDAFFARNSRRFSWLRPKAGTIGFPGLSASQDPAGFCADVIGRAGVMLLPSTVYGYAKPHFRIGFGRENMPEALSRFEACLDGAA